MCMCNNNYLIHSETCIHHFLRDQGNEQWQKYKLWDKLKCVKNVRKQHKGKIYTFSW